MCEFNIQELNLANYRRFENETFTLNPRMYLQGKTALEKPLY